MALCGCGCENDAGIYPRTHSWRGIRKGAPRRYLPGHNGNGVVGSGADLTRFVEEDRGYATPCHIWTGPTNQRGYALVKVGRSSRAAFRVVYEATHGPLPAEWEPDHLCRVRSCIRLDHLEAVTHTENVRRGQRTVLTGADALMLRILAASTSLTNVAMADIAAISRPTLRVILEGRHWTHEALGSFTIPVPVDG